MADAPPDLVVPHEIAPDAEGDHGGFRSEADRAWYDRHFVGKGVLVERALALGGPPAGIPFFLRRIVSYGGWGAWLAGEGEVDATVLRLLVSSMVVDPQEAGRYHAYVRGRAFVVSAAEIAEVIGVPLVEDPFYPAIGDGLPGGVTWDEMVGEITGGRRTALPMGGKVLPEDLTVDYRALWLALTACVLTTTCVVGLRMDHIRFLYAVGVGRPVCLARIYMTLVAGARGIGRKIYIKGTRVLQALADRAEVPRDEGDEMMGSKEGPIAPSIAARSEAQRQRRGRRARAEGAQDAVEEPPAQRPRVEVGDIEDIRRRLVEVERALAQAARDRAQEARERARLTRMMEALMRHAGLEVPTPTPEDVDPGAAGAGPSARLSGAGLRVYRSTGRRRGGRGSSV